MEKPQRIKNIMIRRKDDFLTALEKNWRDALFKPLTTLLWRLGLTANHITIGSFILLIAPIAFHFQNKPLLWQIALLTFIGLCDILDGPMARNNDNVTVLGTWLDHLRDGALVAWGTFLLYSYKLVSLEIILIVWALQLLLIWIIVKDFFVRYLKGLPRIEGVTVFDEFTLNDLQASVIGRLQFFCWTVSYLIFGAYLLWPIPWLIPAGHALLILEIIFASMNIFSVYYHPPRTE